MARPIRYSTRSRRRRKVSKLPIVLLTFLFVAVTSFVMAIVQGKNMVDNYVDVENDASETNSENLIPDIGLTESDLITSSSDESSQPSSESESEPDEPVFGVAVPESEKVKSSYFDDAVFFGDSVTDGISIYDVMANAKVIAYTGINPGTALTREVIKTGDGEKITMIDALKVENPKKIYIMIGINSLGMEKESFIKSYGKMIDAIKQDHPEAIIYVQSITPVTEAYETSKNNSYDITNQKINEFNAAICELAGEKEVYYIDVDKALKDENGALPNEASPKDGIHFGSKYYKKWFEYLRTHTVKK